MLLLRSFPVLAQRTCGTPLAIEQALEHNPGLRSSYERMLRAPVSKRVDRSIGRGRPVAVIPVVVHIVLDDPESITDAQVYSQIAVLNQDYGLNNADTTQIPDVWKPLVGDMKIEFCLAQRTPDGAPTNGIERTRTSRQGFSIDYAAADVKHRSSDGADAWNPDDYLNIWVCNIQGDYLGIGTPPELYPKDEQGVVIQYNAFGTTGNLMPNFNKGRSCTHEIGHFFNLLHPWGDGGSCSPGDYVDDTPPQSKEVYGLPAFPYLEDPCSPNAPGVMINNFMEYTDDKVMNMFTQDQVLRSQTALFDQRASLLSSNGCTPADLKDNDARLRMLLSPSGQICSDKIAPAVRLQNFGKKDLTHLSLTYRTDEGDAHQYQWSGQLKTLDSATITLPAVTVATGAHHFQVYVTQANGQSDENHQNDTLEADFQLYPQATTPFQEGFEEDAFPPPGWEVVNPDGLLTWELTADAARSGGHAVVIRNWQYQANGPADGLISPVFDLQKVDSAFLFFDLAAAVQSNPGGRNAYWDTLEVLVSYDCGQSGTVVYKKWGKDLITRPQPLSSEFVPNSSQWRQDSINLTAFIGKGPLRLVFRNITNFENDLYLDDIQLITKQTNPLLENRKVLVVPNPVTDNLQVQFLNPPADLQAITLYNAAGQVIMRKAAAGLNNTNRVTFNLANEPNGVYFVKISYSDKKELVKKIVKIK